VTVCRDTEEVLLPEGKLHHEKDKAGPVQTALDKGFTKNKDTLICVFNVLDYKGLNS